MAKVSSPPGKAPVARGVATSPSLPPPLPFPPGVVPYRPSTEAPAQPLPGIAPTASPASPEEFPGEAELDHLYSRVVEVIDLDNPNSWPTYKVLPEPTAHTQVFQGTPPQPVPTASSEPRSNGVLGMLSAAVVMFEDSPCPPLDPSAKYWVSVNGTNAGVFDNISFLPPESQSKKGKGPGAKTLNAAYDSWKRACLTGAVPISKPISPNSVFPRIVSKSRAGTKLTPDAKAKRDKIITDFFLSEAARKTATQAHPPDDNAMAVDTVGNIFQSGAAVRFSQGTINTAPNTEGLVTSSLSGTADGTPKTIRKKRNLFTKMQTRPSSICSSDGSDSGASSHTFDFEAGGSSSGYHTPPMQSLSLHVPAVPQASQPQMFWAVIAGKLPGVYFSEEKAMACAGSTHSRVLIYRSFNEASCAYSSAVDAGQIQVILDD